MLPSVMGRRRPLITVKDAANELGLSPRTVRDWVQSRRIEFVRVGGAVRIRPETIDNLIRVGTVPRSTGLGDSQ